MLHPVLGSQALLLPYVLTILPAAWIGGIGAGLTAMVLSVAATVGLFFWPSPPGGWMDADVHLALFAIEAALIVVLTVAVRRAHATAAGHNAAKDALLAAVSHDLRAPLNVIGGWTSLLARQGDDPAVVARATAAIQRAVSVQRRLVDDLVDLSRATAQKLVIAREPVDLHALLGDAIQAVRADADLKHLAIDLHQAAAAARVEGDATRLQQVFGNLLANAVKFTPAHGRISVAALPVPEGVRVEVSDTGPGIPREELSRVFDPFHQVNRARDVSSGGLGLGLSIAHHIVEAHGGSLRAESAGADCGSTFVVTLPAGPAATVDQPSVS
jgi:signal transduction histidine kinase